MAKTPEEKKAYRREYYQKNKERIKAKEREYRQEHSVERLATKSKYRQGHRKEAHAYDAEYRLKHRTQNKNYRIKNREHIRDRDRRVRMNKRNWLSELKTNIKCSMCGQFFPDCPSIIEFHHEGKDPKRMEIARMVGTGGSEEAVHREIAKCIPLCANCHRRVHYLEKQKKKKGSVPVPEPLADDYPEQWGLFR